MRPAKQNLVQEIALARIERLFGLAADEFSKNTDHSHEWTKLAFRIATRNRVRIPDEFKQSYCKRCHHFLVEGKNKRSTPNGNWVAIECAECGHKFKRKNASKNGV